MRRPLRSLLRALSAALLAVAAATAGVEAKPAPKKPAAAAAAAKAKTSKAKAKAKAAREKTAKGAKAGRAKPATGKKGKKATATVRSAKHSAKSAKGKKTVRAAKAVKAARGAKGKKQALATRRDTRPAARRETPRTLASAVPVAPTSVPTVDLATALGADLVTLPDVATTAAGDRVGPARPFAALSATATSMIDEMVNRARSQLGTRYVFGGARPGESLDCSSFARYAMEALGFRLPRTADEQSRLGRAVPRDPTALKPGDLLTFGTRRRVDHVGIYLGEGRFIHASVKSGQVIETTIARNGSLFRKWLGARRLIADADTARPTGG